MRIIKGTTVFSVGLALPMAFTLVIFSGERAWALADPKGCAAAPKIENVDCSKETEDTRAKCGECSDSLEKYIGGDQEKAKQAQMQCNLVSGESAEKAAGGAAATQGGLMDGGTASSLAGKQSLQQKKAQNDVIKNAADKCTKALKSCEGIGAQNKSVVDKNKKECKTAAQNASDTAKDQQAKADKAGENAQKNADNAKKEESAGGMPQIPQIPPPSKGEESTPEQAQYPEAESTIAESAPAEIETSKFDGDQTNSATPAVGFDGTAPANSDSTVNLSPSGSGYSTGGAFRDPASNGFGFESETGAVAASAPPGSSGGSNGLNSSGSSRPGEATAAAEKAAESANPFEIQVGSGGRLGAPRGKSSGDSDSSLDSAATATFNGDFRGDAGAASDQVAAGDMEDIGYTLFKMVKYRYSELKKKGGI